MPRPILRPLRDRSSSIMTSPAFVAPLSLIRTRHAPCLKHPLRPQSPQTRPHHVCSRRPTPSTVTMVAKRPFVSRLASSALKLLITSLCTVADDLDIDIDASSNVALLTGNLNAVSVTVSRICLNGFAVSAGAALYTDQISLESTNPTTGFASPPRLAKPFSVSVRANLTEADLNRPGPVRDALDALLRQILATGLSGAVGRAVPAEIGGIECVLDRVELSDPPEQRRTRSRIAWRLSHPGHAGGNLVLHAHAAMTSGRQIRFAVRTGLRTEANGTIVKLCDPELIWRNISVPMVTIHTIGVKIDDDTKLTHVEIDKGVLSCDGILVISPPSDVARGIAPANRKTSDTADSPGARARRRGKQLPRSRID